MMKLRTILIGAMIAIGSVSMAQENVKYGLKAGVNLANYDARAAIFDVNTQNLTSFYVSAFAEVPLAYSGFYVQPGLSFQGKGGQLSGNFQDGGNVYGITVSERPYWLEVPVNLVGKTDIGNGTQLFVGAGPYVAFGVGGDYKINTKGAGVLDWIPTMRTDLNFGNGGHLKSVDFGLNFIAGIELMNGLSVQGGYGLGLTDVGGNKFFSSNLTKLDQKNRVWSFGLGKTF